MLSILPSACDTFSFNCTKVLPNLSSSLLAAVTEIGIIRWFYWHTFSNNNEGEKLLQTKTLADMTD